MKIVVVSPKNKTLFNFRGDLIKEMIKEGHEVLAIGPNQDYIEDVLNLGVKFQEIPFSKDNTSVVNDLKYFFNLKKILKKEKPDVVFSYNIKPVIYGSLAAYFSGVNKIYAMIAGAGRVYGENSFKIKVIRIITGILYKLAFKCCDKVIFQNKDDLKEFVVREYLPLNKTNHVGGSGVNMKKFKRINLPKEPIFIMISRIIKEKGVLEYLEAAKEVNKIHPEARFILLGGYDKSLGAINSQELSSYIENDYVKYLGEVKSVISILEKARIFVLPTYYREGLPRTILEAMSMGKPIITTNWNGCRDAVKNGVNGLLVEPKNINDLVKKMNYMIENPKEVEKMSENSYSICKNKYDVKIINDIMINIMGLRSQ